MSPRKFLGNGAKFGGHSLNGFEVIQHFSEDRRERGFERRLGLRVNSCKNNTRKFYRQMRRTLMREMKSSHDGDQP